MVEMSDYTPGTPSWVDVSTPNMEATKAFYGGLFGWQGTSYPEMGGYTNFTVNGKLICGAAPTMSPDQHPAWGRTSALPTPTPRRRRCVTTADRWLWRRWP